MFHIVLFEPEIPPNTGNVLRLCANTGCRLHLIRPLGFQLTDKHFKRAGLDYHDRVLVHEYDSLEDFIRQVHPPHLYAIETCGQNLYTDPHYQPEDALIFGSETRGLPQSLLDQIPSTQIVKLPMQQGIRSLNLSNTVAIVAYEAWRQNGFKVP